MTNKESDFLLIGKIVGFHGIKGVLKVFSYVESLSLFEQGSLIFLKHSNKSEESYKIKWTKPHKRGILLCLEEITTRNMAESLAGAELFIEKIRLPELESGTYYWSDLVGLSVFTTDGNYIGSLETIIPTGSNDVYVVKDKENEILIPALESVVISVDLEKKTMTVVLPEGL